MTPVLHTDSECKQVVDLKETFGKRFKIALEADGETVDKWAPEDRPWLYEIRGHNGMVHPYGGELLCAVSNGPRIGARLRALPFILHAKGDEETVVRFHVEHVAEVFEIIRPFRRRQLSEAERERLIRATAAHRFARKDGPETQQTAAESTNGGGFDPSPIPGTDTPGDTAIPGGAR